MMRIVDSGGMDAPGMAELLARPRLETDDQLCTRVAALIAGVRTGGDAALLALTEHFDRVRLASPWVEQASLDTADAALPPDLSAALDLAIATVTRFHEAARPADRRVETAPGVICESRWLALAPVGLYVPAGTAPLPSTAIMLAVPARLAGCRELVIATPPDRLGRADPAVLAVAARLDIRRVLLAGGAQAIAAMAYGTETVPACVKLFGPGNRFVAEAKRQVALDADGAACDLPAGPSEVMVIADGHARPDWVAIDLLSQAEHGPDSQVFLVTDSADLARTVNNRLVSLLPRLARGDTARQALRHGALIVVPDLDHAVKLANAYAPEHLIVATADARVLVDRIRSAGSVFVGDHTPEALGDYISGTNHVLPTGGWARSASGLSVADFMRRMTVQEATPAGLAKLGPAGARLAAHEGLDAHRLAIEMRLAV